VDLIGHSMGGIVARYYVCLGAGAQRVRNLITLGSPHNGTDVSLFGIGAAKKELSPGSALIERLRATPLPRTTAATAIWSLGDALVWSAHQAHLPGGDEIVYDDLGHMGLLASRRVAGDVISILSLQS
jgi:pimeloyl-ACP methyl ester carboxylesterase